MECQRFLDITPTYAGNRWSKVMLTTHCVCLQRRPGRLRHQTTEEVVWMINGWEPPCFDFQLNAVGIQAEIRVRNQDGLACSLDESLAG